MTALTVLLSIILGVLALSVLIVYATWVAWMTVQDLNEGKARREAKQSAALAGRLTGPIARRP